MSIMLLGAYAHAQKISESEVPSSVKTTFSTLYPNTKVEKWEKEKDNYKAKFDQKKAEMCIVIDPNGKLLKTKTKIDHSLLPEAAKDYILKNYAGKKISEAKKSIDADGKVTYEAEVQETNLCFDSAGTFLNSKMEKKKD